MHTSIEILISHLRQELPITEKDTAFLTSIFTVEQYTSKTTFIKPGKSEQNLYFLSSGIVKGYKIVEGKMVVDHLIAPNNFFTSIDSFFNNTPCIEYFESLTDCSVLKTSKANFNLLKAFSNTWNEYISNVTNYHLQCKMERITEFQTLTAKERYLKFLKNSPQLALQAPVESIASFLGMEPQSLSRIRSQITI